MKHSVDPVAAEGAALEAPETGVGLDNRFWGGFVG